MHLTLLESVPMKGCLSSNHAMCGWRTNKAPGPTRIEIRTFTIA